ncbi:MAG: hypothetical protein NWF05_03915 [Candidatus Bathyarchaeota archaeon]|nr:hypothetical protein [Candidatus Bathyarchaeota archaeon]
MMPQTLKSKIHPRIIWVRSAIKKDSASAVVQFTDYVQVYEPALSHEDIMCIAEEFVRAHPKEILLFGSMTKSPDEFSKKPVNRQH